MPTIWAYFSNAMTQMGREPDFRTFLVWLRLSNQPIDSSDGQSPVQHNRLKVI